MSEQKPNPVSGDDNATTYIQKIIEIYNGDVYGTLEEPAFCLYDVLDMLGYDRAHFSRCKSKLESHEIVYGHDEKFTRDIFINKYGLYKLIINSGKYEIKKKVFNLFEKITEYFIEELDHHKKLNWSLTKENRKLKKRVTELEDLLKNRDAGMSQE